MFAPLKRALTILATTPQQQEQRSNEDAEKPDNFPSVEGTVTLESFVCDSDAQNKKQPSLLLQYSSVYLSVTTPVQTSADVRHAIDSAVMSKIYENLQPGGTLTFTLDVPPSLVEEITGELYAACVFSGFVNPQIVKDVRCSASSPLRTIHYAAQRPLWSLGASAPVTADGRIDESSLVDPELKYESLSKGRSDCATKPRACANCTCGRKELEVSLGAEEAKKRLENATVRSSCGNCYMGDAFRCSGCPFRGLPAFRPGDKIQLASTADDLGAQEEMGSSLSTGGLEGDGRTGVVKVQGGGSSISASSSAALQFS